jgi:hypothetical protein
MLALRIVMPCSGDMAVLRQDGGTIDLQPIFYGTEAAGPHIQIVDINGKAEKVVSRFRLKVRADGKVTLARGATAEETLAEDT